MTRLCLPSTAVRDRALAVAGNHAEPGAGLLELIAGAVIYDGAGPRPDELAGVEFWVPNFLGADPAAGAAAAAAMPGLRVIQSQSAGVDVLLPIVGEGVLLCDARGVHGSSTAEWALAALLSVLREFPRFERARQQRRWDPAYCPARTRWC